MAQFDLHSIGRTVVNPDWARPRFLDVALGDFRGFDQLAGQRFSSPTIAAGNPLLDSGPVAGASGLSQAPNLLTNPGFEAGLTGWTATPSVSAGRRTYSPDRHSRSTRRSSPACACR